MREKMKALRTEKDELIADVLNEEQYLIYPEITSDQRKKRRENRPERPNSPKQEN